MTNPNPEVLRLLGVSKRRACEALIWAAATGVLLTGLIAGGAAAVSSNGGPALGAGLYIFVLAVWAGAVPWCLGLLFLGLPIWILGHRFGRTGPVSALVFGAAAPLISGAALQAIAELASGSGSLASWFVNLWFAAGLSVIGAMVGLVARSVAYRP